MERDKASTQPSVPMYPSTEAEYGKAVRAPLTAGVQQGVPLDWAMRRYAEGDNSAFAEVYGYLAPKLLCFLRRLSISPEVAHDLRQETFLCMHRARASFAQKRHVAPWAYAIALNCYIDRGRSSQFRFARVSDEVTDMAGVDATGEDWMIARQTADVIQRTLSSMTESRREAFILLRYEEMSVAAAAQRLGTTKGALKLRAFHAYELVRAALDVTARPTQIATLYPHRTAPLAGPEG